MTDTLKLGAGVLLLIFAKVTIGAISALVNKTWSWDVFKRGVIKLSLIIVAIASVYIAGWLNPDLITVELDGDMVNLKQAVHIILVGAFGYYAVNVVSKIKSLIVKKPEEKESE